MEPEPEEQQRGRHRDLQDELGRCLQRQHVVDETETGNDETAAQQLPETGVRTNGDTENQRGHGNGHASKQRGRTLVPAVFLGPGDEAEPVGDEAAERRQRQRRGQCEQEESRAVAS